MLQRGNDQPARFAESATSASLAGGPDAATIVWESDAGGNKTILCDRIR